MLRRLRVFLILCTVVLIVLTARLAQLQIINNDEYINRAEVNKTRVMSITAPRGEILDRNGLVLATNRPGYTVFISDLDRWEQDRVIAEMSEILDMEEAKIRDLIRQQRFRKYRPIILKTDVDASVIAEIAERRTDLPGVDYEAEPIRIYPENNLAAHALGRTGPITSDWLRTWPERADSYGPSDVVGREGGIEEVWEEYLRGEDGRERVIVNQLSQRIAVEAREDPVPGDNVHLTIDANLQRALEEGMYKVVGEVWGEAGLENLRGAAVAIDPRSGAIRAMVSLPDYDLNNFYQEYDIIKSQRGNPLQNKATKGRYPVGSTYKVLTAVAALEEGIITPTQRINSPGVISVPGVRASSAGSTKQNFNRQHHGIINVVTALKVSSNTFFNQVGYRLGSDLLYEWGNNFSMGLSTGLTDIDRDISGKIFEEQGRDPSGLMDAAIGQRHDITILQMANLTSMIANRGIHYKPYLVEKVVNVNGEIVYEAIPEVINQLEVSEVTWDTVQKGMEQAAELGGTAGRFRNFPYPVKITGKTGSAQHGRPGTLGAHSVFISYAPAEDPEIAIAILVEESGSGGSVSSPVAWEFYEAYFAPYFEINEE